MGPQQAFQLAVQHHQAGRLREAEQLYRQILQQQPNNPDVLHLLGVLAAQAGHGDAGIELIRRAIGMVPQNPHYHSNLAKVLRERGKLEQAIAACREALRLDPRLIEAVSNLGAMLTEMGQVEEAIALQKQAIAINAQFPMAYNNLGMALAKRGDFREAAGAMRQAIAIAPTYAEAYNNLGTVLQMAGELDEAIGAFEKALQLRPTYANSQNNLGNAYKDAGRLDDAIAAYRPAAGAGMRAAASNLVYTLHFHPGYDVSALKREHEQWAKQFAEPLKGKIVPRANSREPERRLKVGYVSPDFRAHAVGRFLLPLFAKHDHSAVEVFCYPDVAVADATTERLRGGANVWRSIVGMTDEQVAALVRQDGIDILVDLTMHMNNNRMLVFAQKPAPVQVTYLAYVSTTGIGAIDYRLSDPYLDPPGSDTSCYVEETVRLPETYWCYEATWKGEVTALGEEPITFGSLNNFGKVTDGALEAWAKILQGVPESRLILHAHRGRHRDRVLGKLAAGGVGAERCRFIDFMPTEAYFQAYGEIGIGLDPFPYTGGTTTCDALWMGVPVVTLAGTTAVGRSGVSLLTNCGVPELIARTVEEYVECAVALGRDRERVAAYRRALRGKMEGSVIMDGARFAKGVEEAYRGMWRRWCAGREVG